MAEAASAAKLRAFAAKADRDGHPNLAQQLRGLAADKDVLAERQLEATGQVRNSATDLAAAIAEERYENDVLYAKMIGESDGAAAQILRDVVAAQRGHVLRLEAMHQAIVASRGDVPVGG
jgi:rubrerythrin